VEVRCCWNISADFLQTKQHYIPDDGAFNIHIFCLLEIVAAWPHSFSNEIRCLNTHWKHVAWGITVAMIRNWDPFSVYFIFH
jgi:hypothetical protein